MVANALNSAALRDLILNYFDWMDMFICILKVWCCNLNMTMDSLSSLNGGFTLSSSTLNYVPTLFPNLTLFQTF